MKFIFSIVIMSLTSHYILAQDQKGIPEWFTHPIKGEYVGVSLAYKDNKVKDKSAEYSAILSYLLSLKKEKVNINNSSKRNENMFDTLTVYNLLLEDGRCVGEMNIKSTHQSDITYADQNNFDNGIIENATTIYNTNVSFSIKCGFELCHTEINNNYHWISLKPTLNDKPYIIKGVIEIEKGEYVEFKSGSPSETINLYTMDMQILKNDSKMRLIVNNPEESNKYNVTQSIDLNNSNTEFSYTESKDPKIIQRLLSYDLSKIRFNDKGIYGTCPLDDKKGEGYLISLIDILNSFVFSNDRSIYEEGIQNVGNFYMGGFTQSYYMPLETKIKPLYAVNTDDERPNNNTFVVIIGNENYQMTEIVPYAKKDAKAFEEYCQRILNVPQNQISFFEDASYGKMKMAIKRLKEVAKAYQGDLKVIFYYAGHGIPDEESKNSYLLPIDADGTMPEVCYSLNDLYSDLGSLNAKQVVVFMDACFSGANRSGNMLQSARGVAIKAKEGMLKGNMVVFSAASGEQTAYPYKSKEHGLFTYYLLNKLEKEKGDVTLGELAKYIVTEVGKTSIIENKKSQTPTVGHSASLANMWQDLKLKE